MYYSKLFYLNNDICENTIVRIEKFETKEECENYIKEQIEFYFEDEENPSFKENATIYGNGFSYDDGELEMEVCYYTLKGKEEEIKNNINELFANTTENGSLTLVNPNCDAPCFGNNSYNKLSKENGELYVYGIKTDNGDEFKTKVNDLEECALICVFQSMVLLYDFECKY